MPSRPNDDVWGESRLCAVYRLEDSLQVRGILIAERHIVTDWARSGSVESVGDRSGRRVHCQMAPAHDVARQMLRLLASRSVRPHGVPGEAGSRAPTVLENLAARATILTSPA